MRKIITVIALMIVFFFIYFLQVNVFGTFTIAGIKPNLFVIYVLFIGLFANQTLGISLGVIFGLIIDFLYGKTIGTSAVMLCVIGYLGSYFDKNFSKENKQFLNESLKKVFINAIELSSGEANNE